MAKIRVSVVHDEIGRIVAIARPSKGANVIITGGEGQSVFETEVDDGAIDQMVSGAFAADPGQRAVNPIK